jgi:hypothetical protein
MKSASFYCSTCAMTSTKWALKSLSAGLARRRIMKNIAQFGKALCFLIVVLSTKNVSAQAQLSTGLTGDYILPYNDAHTGALGISAQFGQLYYISQWLSSDIIYRFDKEAAQISLGGSLQLIIGGVHLALTQVIGSEYGVAISPSLIMSGIGDFFGGGLLVGGNIYLNNKDQYPNEFFVRIRIHKTIWPDCEW